ncbi:MAG: hypothetical protein U0998_10980 [Moraxellaceae bacterium]|nr:hypothetical protein [Moraxellaceae bacterium]MDZ4387695.1 hypothetical protein [Moraxellaceae bacterium]
MLKVTITVVACAVLLAACGGSNTATAEKNAASVSTSPAPRFQLANRCYVVRHTPTNQFLQTTVQGLVGLTPSAEQATPFFMKPTRLGHYVFYDPSARYVTQRAAAEDAAVVIDKGISQVGLTVEGVGDFIDINSDISPVANVVDGIGEIITGLAKPLAERLREQSGRTLSAQAMPDDSAEWEIDGPADSFNVINVVTKEKLFGVSQFAFVPSEGCTDFPEAELNATGSPFKGTNPDGTVFGYAETHMHLGGTELFGGRLGYGQPFHKFGIEHALGDCVENHGPNGDLALVDTVVNPNQGPPQHDTQGWPTYKDWPSYGGQIHHQTYYMWLKRAWMGGLRLMVNHLVANEGLCLLWPIKGIDCNEMETLEFQRQQVLALEDYIDAQAGGPGLGFFRIVTSSAQAREVIANGQMAVILGTENEKIFDCGEFLGRPDCTMASIERDLADWYDRGIRAIFPVHLVDNAFGGTRLTDDPALNILYSLANIVDTGHPYATVSCDGPDNLAPGEATVKSRNIFDTVLLMFTNPPPAPPLTGCQRNARGLTPLGEYFINRLIDFGVWIETDHISTLARNRIFDIAEARGVPVISGHTGEVSPLRRDSDRILQTGGLISQLPDTTSTDAIKFVQDLAALYTELFGDTRKMATGLGSDINGLHIQARPRDDVVENPLRYPFRSFDGRVTFDRQVTGQRIYDLNTDGVAHYGLFPDFLADMQMQPGGSEALAFIFKSAEAYLQRWEAVERRRIQN